MNINFELYRIFYVVANHSNITKASEELNISQPAISKSIKNLEDQLGGNLFIRTKRGVTLTEEGKEFYNYIKQAMEYINNAEKKFTNLINLETGCIKIGINTTLTKEFLLPFLEEFHSLYPKIDNSSLIYEYSIFGILIFVFNFLFRKSYIAFSFSYPFFLLALNLILKTYSLFTMYALLS